MGGRIVGIRTTSERFGDWLDDVFVEYRVDAEPEEWNFSVVVQEEDASERGRRRLNVLYWKLAPVVRTTDLAELGRHLFAQLEVFPMPQREDALYLGSSLLASNGTKILVPSPVAFYLHRKVRRRAERAGVPLPTASFVAVDPDSGRLLPFRPLLEVPADALDRLPGSGGTAGPSAPVGLNEPTEVDVVWTLGTSVDHILEPTSRGYALHNLMGSTVNLERLGAAALDTLVPLVRRAECFGVIPVGKPQIVEALAESLGLGGKGVGINRTDHAHGADGRPQAGVSADFPR